MDLLTALVVEGVAALVLFTGVYLLFLRPNLLKSAARESELAARQAQIEAKEEAVRIRAEAEEEARSLRQSLARYEERLSRRESALLDEEEAFRSRQRQIEAREAEVAALELQLAEEAERRQAEALRLSTLTVEQAKAMVMDRLETELHDWAAERARAVESDAVADAERKARRLLIDAMQRSCVAYVSESTLAVIELPSEDMKGRLIGREGRNIRAFEQVTGVDLIIDDTPEAVVVSSFDPVRREIARLTLMNLMMDGRIHPARIEELHEKASAEVRRMIVESGEKAADRVGIHDLPSGVVENLGKLRFRTSYGQNVLDHSVEVAVIAGHLASELGLDSTNVRRAGLLHDIGKALGDDWPGPHALAGMEYLKSVGESSEVCRAVGAHHQEIPPETETDWLVILGDTVSAARPGARRENLENYVKRMGRLEELAAGFPGVEKCFAVQAGREVRILVRPSEVDDLGLKRLAREVARRIEQEFEYGGQIRITVIRETRETEVVR
ncbi:MAG: ribonuclease Y [Fimbriimonadaceae bacterium]